MLNGCITVISSYFSVKHDMGMCMLTKVRLKIHLSLQEILLHFFICNTCVIVPEQDMFMMQIVSLQTNKMLTYTHTQKE